MGAILGFCDQPYMVSSKCDAQLDRSSVQKVLSFVQEAEAVVNMTHGLYLYSIVVELRTVCGSIVPLLHIVPLKGKHGDTVPKNFYNVQYVSVLYIESGTYEIHIRYDSVRPVPFECGKVKVKLLFFAAERRVCSEG